MSSLIKNTGHTTAVYRERLNLILGAIDPKKEFKVEERPQPRKPFCEFEIYDPSQVKSGRLVIKVFLHDTTARIMESTGDFHRVKTSLGNTLSATLPKERHEH